MLHSTTKVASTAPAVKPLLLVPEVAKILGIPVRAVYDLVESRDPAQRIPHVKIGRRVRFLPDQILEYVCSRIAGSASQRAS